MLSQGVSHACFVHYVWVLPREVDDHDPRTVNKFKNVLDKRSVFPDIIRAITKQAHGRTGVLDCLMGGIEFRLKGHHSRYHSVLWLFVGHTEHLRTERDNFFGNSVFVRT